MATVRVLKLLTTPLAELPPEMLDAWSSLADQDELLEGPFLHPAFATTADRVRPGVEVGVILQGGEAVGFLPFERTRFGVGRPVGGRLCDRSGVIARAGTAWDAAAMTRAAGLRMLRLTHVPACIPAFAPYLGRKIAAPFMDLSNGFEGYRRTLTESGSSMFKRMTRLARKLGEEVGPVRFEWNDTSPEAFDVLMRWKARKREATRTPNVLDLPWARALLAELRLTDETGFGGVMSTLYAGDRLCAAHFGLRSRRVLHYWLPAYDEGLSQHSPGMLLLLRIAEAASERGIHRVELGPGDEPYKLRAGTGQLEVSEATACASAAASTLVGAADALRTWSRGSAAGAMLRAAGRRITRGGYRVRSTLGVGADSQPVL